MKMNKLLIVAIIAAEILSIFSADGEPSTSNEGSLKFVKELNQLLSPIKRINEEDYCSDKRLGCNEYSQINKLEIIGNDISVFPVAAVVSIKDTLQILSIRDANISSSIPKELYELSELKNLALDGNSFSGTLDDKIGNLSKLEILDLSQSKLSGKIPEALYSLNELKTLKLQGNSFNGGLSDSIKNLTNLVDFNIGELKLSGSIPDSLYSLKELKHLVLRGNNFSGSLSQNISNLINLLELDSSRSGLSGPIPEGLYSLVELKELNLSSNNINGTLLSNIGSMVGLKTLDLSTNQLSGTIPSEIGNLTNLEYLDISVNQFEGDIPDLSGLKKLTNMNISSTKHNLNANCDDAMLPPSIEKKSCFIRPVSRLCSNVTRCEYSDKPMPKSSVDSMFYTYGLKVVVMMLVCRTGIEIMSN
ncbi:uncharacterized protein LOC126320558 [Schistocerca gregaria]|uniref:uncharacterized protein LOC126320558 n=1 Tax=Schistocerca gregaria TaxID=7010 RepID=UPI00211F4687|nr:uncharacterized protein LOC126320558 [Schistocerca gregaria]